MATPAGTAATAVPPAAATGAPVPAPSVEETAKKAAKAAKVEKYRAQYNLPAEMSSEDVPLDHVTDCLTKKSRAKKDTTKKTPQQFPDGHKPPPLGCAKGAFLLAQINLLPDRRRCQDSRGKSVQKGGLCAMGTDKSQL